MTLRQLKRSTMRLQLGRSGIRQIERQRDDLLSQAIRWHWKRQRG